MTGALRRLTVILLVTVGVFQAVLSVGLEISWDEFLNLSMLYDYRRGELREILQTGFLHLFWFLPATSENEVVQVIFGRTVVAVFAIGTSCAIWASGRKLTSPYGAGFAVIAYWTFSYVMQHGVALRTDALAATLVMGSVWMLLDQDGAWRRGASAGVLLGLAGVLTIKSILLVPMLVSVALVRVVPTGGWRAGLAQVARVGTTAVVTFLLAIALHATSLSQTSSPLAFLQRTTTATLGDPDRSIFFAYLLDAVPVNPVLCLLVGATPVVLLARLLVEGKRIEALTGLALLLPLAIPLVYRDMYPYVYSLFLPPVTVAMAYGFEAVRVDISPAAAGLVLLLLGGSYALKLTRTLPRTNDHQRVILEVIHETFPEASPYIDARSMVSSYRKKGLFMSAWGMTDYRAAGEPVMGDILSEDAPAFLLANHAGLQLDRLTPRESEAFRYGLLAEDFGVLQDNFVPFWGPVWVPGRRIRGRIDSMAFHVPGVYVNRGPGEVEVARRVLPVGDSVFLASGSYRVNSQEGATLAIKYPEPDRRPPDAPVFRGF